MWHLCEKRRPKNASKKGAPPKANKELSAGQEAPGEAASRAHFSDKKQLFEQQLKHCSKFLQKKSELDSKSLQKLKSLQKTEQQTEWIAENMKSNS